MKILKIFFIGFLFFTPLPLFAATAAQPTPQSSASAPLAQPPAPPALTAKSYLLLDYNSGHVIASLEADQRIEPASLTKLMTVYIAFDALKHKRITLDQDVQVSTKAWKTGGSRMFIEPNKPVTVEQLLHGIIVQSGNDAAVALAETIAGSADVFAQMMNREAKRLGMTHTHFVNPDGLPNPEHYSTAHDLSLLTAALIRDFPEYYPYFAVKKFTYNKITQPNRNRLLWMDPTVDGLKTGHTEEAGYCLIASAKRGDRRLISVVLGTPSDSARVSDSQKLLNYGFQFFDDARLYQANQPAATLPVYKGKESSVKAGFTRDIYLTVPKGAASRLKATLDSRQPLIAPISAEQQVGVMKVTLDSKPVAELPVVALADVAQAGFFKRGWDAIRLWFK